jgi:hypothetical protein
VRSETSISPLAAERQAVSLHPTRRNTTENDRRRFIRRDGERGRVVPPLLTAQLAVCSGNAPPDEPGAPPVIGPREGTERHHAD